MARSLIGLQVLVSSPSDVTDEREIVAEAIDELNLTWRRGGTIQLNLIRWETDVRPGLGEDAQTVINQQIGEGYDIFIGIMGARFGTPTRRAESGTEEEFNRAVARFQQDPNSVSVMFYFKDSPPASLSEIDPEQLMRVQTFQRRVQRLGLVKIFRTKDEFARLMRMHLSQEAQEWPKRVESIPQGPSEVGEAVSTESTSLSATVGDEEGYIDLLEAGEDGSEEVSRTMGRIGSAIDEIGARTAQQTAELNEVQAAAAAVGKKVDLKAVKRISNQLAEYLLEFVTRLENEIPLYGAGSKRAVDPFMRAISMSEIKGDTPEQILAAMASVEKLIGTHENAIANSRSFRDTMATTPRITTAYNRARRRAVEVMDRLIDEFEKSLRLSRELYEILKKRSEGLI